MKQRIAIALLALWASVPGRAEEEVRPEKETTDLLELLPVVTDEQPLCSTCDGAGTVACATCDEAGKIQLACEHCDGRGTAECSASGCDKGKKVCRTCGGKGELRSTELTVQGGSSVRSKPCSTCGGSGATDCRQCKAGKTSCFKCKGGKREFFTRCDACGGKKVVPCEPCAAVGRVAPPALDPNVAKRFRGIQARFAEVEALVAETSERLASLRERRAAAIERSQTFPASLETIAAVPESKLSQYLIGLRRRLAIDWKLYQDAYLADESEEPTLESRLAEKAELAAASRAALEGLETRYDGRQSEELGRILPQVNRLSVDLESEVRELEADVFRETRPLRRLADDTDAIASDIELFLQKAESHAAAVAEDARRLELERRNESPSDALRRRVRELTVTSLAPPRFAADVQPHGDGSVSLLLSYFDSAATRVEESRAWRLSDDHLARVPAVFDALFETRTELASIVLDVLARSTPEPYDASGDPVRPTAVQTFSVTRSDWTRAKARSRSKDGEDGAADSSDETRQPAWRELLAACDPKPDYPPVEPRPSYGWVSLVLLPLCGIAALVGLYLMRASSAKDEWEIVDDEFGES